MGVIQRKGFRKSGSKRGMLSHQDGISWMVFTLPAFFLEHQINETFAH